MDEKLCTEKHHTIDDKFVEVHKRLDEHGKDIDVLKSDSATFKVEIRNLCEQVADLVKTLKWFMALLIAGTITFFFTNVLPKILKL